MSRNNFSLRVGLMVALLFLAGCQSQQEDDDPRDGPAPPLVDERVLHDHRHENGEGPVVVQLEDGIGVYFFDGTPFPVASPPRPITGEVVHWQHHTIVLPDGSSHDRWILLTSSGDGQTTVTVYGPDPDDPLLLRQLGRHTHEGMYERFLINEQDLEKTFLFGDDGLLLINLVDGSARGSSNAGVSDDVLSVEVVGGLIVLIEEWNNETEIRLRVMGPDGHLVATIVMPGDYETSTTDGQDIKAVVTRHNGTIFQDLIRVSTGTMITQQAGNGMNGDHAHLQFDPVAGGRFIEIVYNAGRDDTEMRVMDSSGTVLATHILPGQFQQAVVSSPSSSQHKVIATEKNGIAAATVVDLATGRQGSITQGPGSFQRLTSDSSGVTLGSGGQSLPVTIP